MIEDKAYSGALDLVKFMEDSRARQQTAALSRHSSAEHGTGQPFQMLEMAARCGLGLAGGISPAVPSARKQVNCSSGPSRNADRTASALEVATRADRCGIAQCLRCKYQVFEGATDAAAVGLTP